jgi:hypothetical protein
MVVWGFEIGELLAAALRYRHLRFRQFCIKIIIKGIQKSEITDCDTGGCGMWAELILYLCITNTTWYLLLSIKYYACRTINVV